MVKRPADLDPENFVDGKRWHLLGHPAVAYADDVQFRIDPAPVPPFPVFKVLALTLFYALFFGGCIAFLVTHHDPGVSEFEIYAACTTAGLIASGGTLAVLVISRWLGVRELAGGPWLRFDKRTQQVELPRKKLAFELKEIVYLQYVTTASLELPRTVFKGSTQGPSELNLVTMRGGKRERWNLVNSCYPSGAFEKVLDPLIEHAPIPVVRITESAGPWKVWIRPYCDAAGPVSAVQSE
jgi:hypothetical protein